MPYAQSSLPHIQKTIEGLKQVTSAQLTGKGFEQNEIEFLEFLNLRYEGTDTAIMTLNPAHENSKDAQDYVSAFVKQYKQEYGFVIEVIVPQNHSFTDCCSSF